ncbi:MAG: hypothetical protein LC750_09040 [Actinobacteria bacterium]|nr:hypothetical protein [Actinomycetota bacterium]
MVDGNGSGPESPSGASQVEGYIDASVSPSNTEIVWKVHMDARFINDMAEAIHGALDSAMSAWALRDDLFENAADQTIAAQVAATAIVEHLAGPTFMAALTEAIGAAFASARQVHETGDGSVEDPADSGIVAQIATTTGLEYLTGEQLFVRRTEIPAEKIAAIVARLAYKDWSFSAVKLPDGTVGVRVVAPLQDRKGTGRLFRRSRVAIAASGATLETAVAEAAFQAIMAIEEHEAREELRLGERRPLNPHVQAVPLATNRRKIEHPRTSPSP